MDDGPLSPALWGSFGEAGRDESVSSSMSECEDGGLVDFFFPKACLKELLSCKNSRQLCFCPSDLWGMGIGGLVCRCRPSHCLGSVYKSRVLTMAAQYSLEHQILCSVFPFCSWINPAQRKHGGLLNSAR